MKIKRLEFENFRNFRDRCCIDFPTDGGVTVIYGPNGVGKTTLHQLFQWIFYGETHFNNTASPEMYNLDLEHAASFHDSFSVWGKIAFEHPDENGLVEQYSLRREWIYKKEHTSSKLIGKNFRLSKKVGDDWKTVLNNDENRTIERILPSGLSQYFFFDGESMIADLNQKGRDSAKSLRKALYTIFDLDIYEQASVHIGSQSSGSSTVLGKLYLSLSENSTNSAVIVARGDYQRELKRVEKLQEEIAGYKVVIASTEKQIRDLSEQIGGAPARKGLEGQRKDKKNHIKTLEETVQKEMKSFGAAVMDQYPTLLISRVVQEAELRIGLKIEEQKLPKGLTKELLQTLLAEEVCLCGHPITEKEKQVLEELVEMFPPRSYKYIYDQFKKSAQDLTATYSAETLLTPIETIFKKKDEIRKLQEEIREIDETLKQSGNVEDLIAQRAEAEDHLKVWKQKLSAAERDLGVKERLKNQCKAKLDKTQEENEANLTIRRKIEVMEAVKLYFDTRLEYSAKKYSRELGESIQDLLNQMLSTRRDVSMSTRFELSVKDSHGNEAKSEGQFAVVSFAYIGGIFKLLREVDELKGKEFPLVLDGPFSKLDAYHRQNVIDVIPSYAPQIILFSKDDINDCFGPQGIENVWTIYSNEERNISTVKRGYDPEVFKANAADN